MVQGFFTLEVSGPNLTTHVAGCPERVISTLSLFVLYLMEYRNFQMMWLVTENGKFKFVPTHVMTTYKGVEL
jgi:hypothetical protein